MLSAMLTPHFVGGGPLAVAPDLDLLLTPYRIALICLVCASALIPGAWVTGKVINGLDGTTRWARVTTRSAVTVLAPYAAMVAIAGTFSPFLYFKF